MQSSRRDVLPVRSAADVVQVRQRVRHYALEMRFSLVDQTKLVTAASELARNTLDHGKGGECTIEVLQNGIKSGLRLEFSDRGPGIPDIQQALKDGFTTGNGMGLGLGGARRLVNDFEITSRVGEGTRITVVRWK